MLDLAGVDELLDGAGDVLDRRLRVDAVLVVQVDRVGAEAAQRPVHSTADGVGSAGQAGLGALLVEGEPELRGDDHLLAERAQGVADELLVDVRAVDLGGVEQGDAPLDGAAEDGDHLVAVAGIGAEALAHSHAAEPDGRDLEPITERALLHLLLLAV